MGEGATTVVCRIQYSGRAPALIGALALATCALIAITPVPSAVRALAAAWTVGIAFACARRVSPGVSGTGPRVFVVRATGEIAVMESTGSWTRGSLRDGSFVAPWLLIVRWRAEGARRDRTVLLLPGMAEAESLRRVRVILRWR